MFDARLGGLPCTARGLAEFGRILREKIRGLLAPLADYARAVAELMRVLDTAGIAPEVEAKRFETARALTDWLARIEAATTDIEMINAALATTLGAEGEAEAQAVFSRIETLASAHFDQQTVNGLRNLTNPAFSTRGNSILDDVAHSVLRHEYVTSLVTALAEGKSSAQSLLIEAATQGSPSPEVVTPEQILPGEQVVYRAEQRQLNKANALKLLAEVKAKLDEHPHAVVDIVVVLREAK